MSEENGMSRRVMLVKLGILLNAIVGAVLAVRKKVWIRVVALARRTGAVSCRPDSACDVSQSRGQFMGRRNRGHRVLGSERRQSDFPGLCHQLCAPWMPGSMVPTVEPVYVPLSRRSLLPGRIPRLRTSRTRIVSVQPQNRRWKDFY